LEARATPFQAQDKVAGLETSRRTELPDDGGCVLVLGIDGIVEAADVGGGKFACEIGEGGAKLGEFGERGLADDGDGVVRREVVAIVFEGDEAEGVDEAVSGVAGDDVHLTIDEGAVDKAEVHNAGLPGEMEIVAIAPAAETVVALKEFEADAHAPFGGDGGDIGNGAEMEIFGVVAADDHGKRVFEAEGLGEFEMKLIGIELLDAAIDGGGIGLRKFIQDGGEGGAGVFDVEVELADEERFVDEEGAAEVGLANDGDAGASFDVLGEELGEDDLFGEELGADGDFGLRRFVAGREKADEVYEIKEVKETKSCAAHVRWKFSWDKRRKNLAQRAQRAQRTQRKKSKKAG
jgi:hypothetical protein